MKRGFTLVELLAVIVILSIIAIITVPIIGNVIEESKKKALEQSAYGLVEAADYYAINNDGEYSFLFDNSHNGENIDKTKQLDYKGNIEGEGKLYINNNGDISLCINTDKYTVYKSYNGEIVIENISDKGECNVKKLGNHYVAYLENEGVDDYITSSDLALYALKTDLNNYVTNEDLQDAFDLKLGTETLTTESQNVIGAINELNDNINSTSASNIGLSVNGTYGYVASGTYYSFKIGNHYFVSAIVGITKEVPSGTSFMCLVDNSTCINPSVNPTKRIDGVLFGKDTTRFIAQTSGTNNHFIANGDAIPVGNYVLNLFF